MYSLHLTCKPGEVEELSVALWEAGTLGIREEDRGQHVELIAGFEEPINHDSLAAYHPTWEREAETDWVLATQAAWPARLIGQRLFLTPVWNTEATPPGRVRVIHNPGLASGTGEHPCTQLALESLERCVHEAQRARMRAGQGEKNTPSLGPASLKPSPSYACSLKGCLVVDVGTGSGILSIAALRLGAQLAVALDRDYVALATASENFQLNELPLTLAAGSANCVASEVADVVVANISGTVLLSMADELLRVLRPSGRLILTGFPESELHVLMRAFGPGEVSGMNEWRCLTITNK